MSYAIFFPRNPGVLTVLSLESGEVLHRSRLGGNLRTAGHLYAIGQ